MANFVDFVLDLETTGKRAWHGVRGKVAPPRITQFALIKLDPTDPTKFKPLIGGPAGHGWTDIIGPLIEKYKPLSAEKLPPAFWRELTMYDPSVRIHGSILNTQVKRHVQAYIDQGASGVNSFKSPAEYIKIFKTEVQKEINRGNAVRINAYSKGFDISEIINESRRTGADPHADFMDWLTRHVDAGRKGKPGIVLRGVEENIHRGMFELMLEDEKVLPRFASSQYFQQAAEAGLESVGIEATTPHHALREFMTDLKKLKMKGSNAKEVLQGLPAEIQSKMSAIKNYDDFTAFYAWMGENPAAAKKVLGHYNKKAAQTHGADMVRHVRTMGFEYISGWRQDQIAKILKLGAIQHEAFRDTIDSAKIMLHTSNPQIAKEIAKEVLTNEQVIAGDVGEKYVRYLEEHVVAGLGNRPSVKALTKVAYSKPRAVPRAVASRLARSPLTLPIMAAAGGLILADQLRKNGEPERVTKGMREMMEGKIEGLRKAVGQWDSAPQGIRPSFMNFSIDSAFHSGRWDDVWGHGTYKGVPMAPSVYHYRQRMALNPELAYDEAMRRASSERPPVFGPTKEEINNQQIDLSDYIYELKDADTILLRKAWLKTNIPLIGPVISFVQKHLMNLTRSITGYQGGFSVRVAGLDAPEVDHPNFTGGENWTGGQAFGARSTAMMEELMRGDLTDMITGGRATHIQLKSGQTLGRYVGSVYAGGFDVGAELVRRGGAIALSAGGQESPYGPMEAVAVSGGRGMWQHPEYAGIVEAKRRGIRPIMSHLQKPTEIGRSLQAAATHSLMVYAMNPQMSGIRDQQSQNLYVRGY